MNPPAQIQNGLAGDEVHSSRRHGVWFFEVIGLPSCSCHAHPPMPSIGSELLPLHFTGI